MRFQSSWTGESGLHRLLADENELSLPVVVMGEYLFGVQQSKHWPRYERWFQENLPFFSLLPIGPATARQYAAIRRELKTAGKPMPTNDLWIAALAREHGCPVISQDGHFRHVRGVKQLSW